MTLTKETIVDKIEVLEMGQIQIRTATRIKENGVAISSTFSRKVIEPDATDITKEDSRVQKIANAVWTAPVKSSYIAAKAERQKRVA